MTCSSNWSASTAVARLYRRVPRRLMLTISVASWSSRSTAKTARSDVFCRYCPFRLRATLPI